MPSVEERLATLEGRVQEQAAFMADIRGSLGERVGDLRREMELCFQQVDVQFAHMNQRFEQVNQRFEQVDKRFDRMESRFTWLMGVMVTGFLTMIGALVAR
jgi:uncharacterized coiled-coil protein SlyX